MATGIKLSKVVFTESMVSKDQISMRSDMEEAMFNEIKKRDISMPTDKYGWQ